MNNNRPVLRLANDIYENNAEMLAIYNTQSDEVSSYETIIQRVFLNNLVKYCNVKGIRRFEAIFNIQADEVEDSLDLRKARIINKFNQLPPFTKIYVKKLLNEIFGEENNEFLVYNDDYKVKVLIESNISGLVAETFKDLRQMIPANIIIEQLILYPYVHAYLKKYYTHEEMQQFTHGDLENG